MASLTLQINERNWLMHIISIFGLMRTPLWCIHQSGTLSTKMNPKAMTFHISPALSHRTKASYFAFLLSPGFLQFSSLDHCIASTASFEYILNGFVENGKNRSKIVWLAFLFKRYPHSEWWTAFAAHWFIVRDYFAMEIIVCYYYAKALFTYNSFHNYCCQIIMIFKSYHVKCKKLNIFNNCCKTK